MSMLPYIAALGLIAILAVLLSVALDVREIRRLLSSKPVPRTLPGHHHARDFVRVAAFSVWACKQNQWLLVQECGQEGCHCGPPPNRPGRFEGEVVRKECSAPGTP